MSMISRVRYSSIASRFLPVVANIRYKCRQLKANQYSEPNTISRHSLKTSLYQPKRLINVGSKFIDCSLSNFSYKHEYKDYKNHKHKTQFDGPDLKFLASLLGLVGLFKFDKTESGDIEKEKVKLTDEEKMKKMKPIDLKIAKGVLAMCDQEYNKADVLFHEALEMAQQDKDDEQETLILNLLASNYFESGDLEEAEKLFIDLIKRMVNNDIDPTNPAILELSLKLASIYSKNSSTHEKALKGFKFVIRSLLNSLGDVLDGDDPINIHDLSDERKNELALLGWSYDWFAKHLLSLNDYDGASRLQQKALQISTKILGPSHDQTLILLNDVGTTLAMDNSPKEGRLYIKKAVEGAIESQSSELASFYVNLGLVDLKLGRLSKAKRYCEYSIELASKNQHYNSHEVIALSKKCLSEVERLMEMDEK